MYSLFIELLPLLLAICEIKCLKRVQNKEYVGKIRRSETLRMPQGLFESASKSTEPHLQSKYTYANFSSINQPDSRSVSNFSCGDYQLPMTLLQSLDQNIQSPHRPDVDNSINSYFNKIGWKSDLSLYEGDRDQEVIPNRLDEPSRNKSLLNPPEDSSKRSDNDKISPQQKNTSKLNYFRPFSSLIQTRDNFDGISTTPGSNDGYLSTNSFTNYPPSSTKVLENENNLSDILVHNRSSYKQNLISPIINGKKIGECLKPLGDSLVITQPINTALLEPCNILQKSPCKSSNKLLEVIQIQDPRDRFSESKFTKGFYLKPLAGQCIQNNNASQLSRTNHGLETLLKHSLQSKLCHLLSSPFNFKDISKNGKKVNTFCGQMNLPHIYFSGLLGKGAANSSGWQYNDISLPEAHIPSDSPFLLLPVNRRRENKYFTNPQLTNDSEKILAKDLHSLMRNALSDIDVPTSLDTNHILVNPTSLMNWFLESNLLSEVNDTLNGNMLKNTINSIFSHMTGNITNIQKNFESVSNGISEPTSVERSKPLQSLSDEVYRYLKNEPPYHRKFHNKVQNILPLLLVSANMAIKKYSDCNKGFLRKFQGGNINRQNDTSRRNLHDFNFNLPPHLRKNIKHLNETLSQTKPNEINEMTNWKEERNFSYSTEKRLSEINFSIADALMVTPSCDVMASGEINKQKFNETSTNYVQEPKKLQEFITRKTSQLMNESGSEIRLPINLDWLTKNSDKWKPFVTEDTIVVKAENISNLNSSVDTSQHLLSKSVTGNSASADSPGVMNLSQTASTLKSYNDYNNFDLSNIRFSNIEKNSLVCKPRNYYTKKNLAVNPFEYKDNNFSVSEKKCSSAIKGFKKFMGLSSSNKDLKNNTSANNIKSIIKPIEAIDRCGQEQSKPDDPTESSVKDSNVLIQVLNVYSKIPNSDLNDSSILSKIDIPLLIKAKGAPRMALMPLFDSSISLNKSEKMNSTSNWDESNNLSILPLVEIKALPNNISKTSQVKTTTGDGFMIPTLLVEVPKVQLSTINGSSNGIEMYYLTNQNKLTNETPSCGESKQKNTSESNYCCSPKYFTRSTQDEMKKDTTRTVKFGNFVKPTLIPYISNIIPEISRVHEKNIASNNEVVASKPRFKPTVMHHKQAQPVIIVAVDPSSSIYSRINQSQLLHNQSFVDQPPYKIFILESPYCTRNPIFNVSQEGKTVSPLLNIHCKTCPPVCGSDKPSTTANLKCACSTDCPSIKGSNPTGKSGQDVFPIYPLYPVYPLNPVIQNSTCKVCSPIINKDHRISYVVLSE